MQRGFNFTGGHRGQGVSGIPSVVPSSHGILLIAYSCLLPRAEVSTGSWSNLVGKDGFRTKVKSRGGRHP